MSKNNNLSLEEIYQQTLLNNINQEKSFAKKYNQENLFKIPDFIKYNIKNEFRYYQKETLENLILLLNSNENLINEIINPFSKEKETIEFSKNHYLFHLATGSGKTLLMAATILYFYKLGYRKYIFFTKQSNLIKKTKNNIIPSYNSKKYEFKNKTLNIEGKKINIKEVKNFSNFNNDNIEIIFKTITDLHNSINDNKENNITLETLKKDKIILLGDEAHNFNATTKKQQEESNSWEKTINTILNLNEQNKLIELTATILFEKETLYNKYKNKLVYNYTFKEFNKDKYCKDLEIIGLSNNTKEDKKVKTLLALIINQYKYKVANKYKIPLIPKILFKCSGSIEELEQERNEVLEFIKELDLKYFDYLLKQLEEFDKEMYKIIFKDFNNLKNKEDFIYSIKRDFIKNSSIIIHSKNSESELNEKREILNNLDNNNSIRFVFAINILNEGWDVLSLFDIVKFDAITIAGKNSATVSDKQLLGRGLRIFPFNYKDFDIFKRKFDENIENELRILETLHFFTSNDHNYKYLLKEELKKDGYPVGTNEKRKLIEENNELSEIPRWLKENGMIIFNEKKLKFKEKTEMKNFNFDININLDFFNINKNENISLCKILLNYNDKNLIIKALNKTSILNFNILNKNFNINTYEELWKQLKELENINFNLKGKTYLELNYEEKILMFQKMFQEIFNQLEKKKIEFKGGDINIKKPIKKIFNQYFIGESKIFNFEENFFINNDNKNIVNNNNFYYNKISYDAINTELRFLYYLNQNQNSKNFLIIRNENRLTFFNNKGVGFQPDFVILKKINNEEIKIYLIEPKGNHLLDNDKWKEDFLINNYNNNGINNLEFENNNIKFKIKGLPFFKENDNNNYIEKYLINNY